MEGEKKARRTYDKDFILEAVKMAIDSGNVSETARNLGIHENQLYTWKRKYEADPENAFPGKGHMKPLEEENRRLKRELERAQRQRDILKKAVGIFSKDPKRYSDLYLNTAMNSVYRKCAALLKYLGADSTGG